MDLLLLTLVICLGTVDCAFQEDAFYDWNTTCDFFRGSRRHSRSYTKSGEGWSGPLVKYECGRVESLIPPPPPPLREGFKGGKDTDKVYREIRSTSNGARSPDHPSGQPSPAERMPLTACKAEELTRLLRATQRLRLWKIQWCCC